MASFLEALSAALGGGGAMPGAPGMGGAIQAAGVPQGGLMDILGMTGAPRISARAPASPPMPESNPVGGQSMLDGLMTTLGFDAPSAPRVASPTPVASSPPAPSRNPARAGGARGMGGMMGEFGMTGGETTAPPLVKAFADALAPASAPVPTRSPGAPTSAPAPVRTARAPTSVPPVPSRAPSASPSRSAQTSPIATASVTPAAEPASSGPKITGKDVTQFFRNVAAGAAGNTNSPVGAFMTGAHRALATGERAEEKEAATALAADERSFERGLKTSKERREQAAENRANREAQIQNAKVIMEIMRMSDPNGTLDDRLKVSRALSSYAQAINKDGTLGEDELREKLEAERERITGRPSPASGVAQTQPQAQPAPQPQTPAGDGSSRAAPAKPMNKQDFDALPSGAYFVNPADGRVLRKS